MMRICYILFSGGLDSTLAFLSIISGDNPVTAIPIFFNYGQRAWKEEARAVMRLVPALRQRANNESTIIEDCRIFNIIGQNSDLFSWSQSSILESRPISTDIDVENRNMILISHAVSIFMSEQKRSQDRNLIEQSFELVVGFLNEHYDTSLSFKKTINNVLDAIMQKPIHVVTPLIPNNQGKRPVSIHKLVKIAHSLDAYSLLEDYTWSCYYPKAGNPCKHCKPCLKRINFFRELEIKNMKKSST